MRVRCAVPAPGPAPGPDTTQRLQTVNGQREEQLGVHKSPIPGRPLNHDWTPTPLGGLSPQASHRELWPDGSPHGRVRNRKFSLAVSNHA